MNVNVYYLNIVHQLFSFKISFNLTDHIENSRGAHLTDETSDRSLYSRSQIRVKHDIEWSNNSVKIIGRFWGFFIKKISQLRIRVISPDQR